MTGELDMAISQQLPHISNAVLHPNSTTGTMTGSQVLWLAGLHLLSSMAEAINQCTHVLYVGALISLA